MWFLAPTEGHWWKGIDDTGWFTSVTFILFVSMLQIYYLARGRQFVWAYALSMVSLTKIHMHKLIIVLISEK